ncbi:porin (plasmid) [Acinetobacter johnsonii]|uniref:Porin n=1 Tax=Acinetobacter johnsonii TaxID=40214 RepID=A0A3S9AQG4_ACIJO|nr:DcaP family trimeric outer membrane transporter [Acinetobacter johnsonii]AZN65837.1 porin [Acinetobacter johnsonii]
MKKKLVICMLGIMVSPAYANQVDSKILELENQILLLKQQMEEDRKVRQYLVSQQQEIKQDQLKNNNSKSQFSEHDLKFYGQLRLDGAIDFESSNGGTFGKLNSVPLEGTNGNRSEFNLTASRLGVDLKKNINGKDLNAKIETDFWDGSSGDGKLRIRHAYIDYNNWLLGQTVSLTGNLETATESVDYTAFLGTAWVRVPQVRYNFTLDEHHNLKTALEYVNSRSSELPALTAKYTYKNGDITGLVQGFVNEKRAHLADKDIDKLGWGVGAGLKYQITPSSSIQGNYYHIEGDQKFLPYTAQGSTANNALAGGDFSVNAAEDDLDLNELDSYVIGFSHKFNPLLRMNLAASLFQYADDTAYAKNNPLMNKTLTDYAANIYFTPIKSLELGVEYHYGNREVFNGSDVDVSRLNLAAIYKF